MKKLLAILAFIFVVGLAASAPVNLYFFYGDGCPHCAAEEPFLDKMVAKYPGLTVYRYETWSNSSNVELYKKMAAEYGAEASGVPMTFICDKAILGFGSEETTGVKIEDAIKAGISGACNDKGKSVLGSEDVCAINSTNCSASPTPSVNPTSNSSATPTSIASASPNGKKRIVIAFFHSPTCPHCRIVEAHLVSLKEKYPQIEIWSYNVLDSANLATKSMFDKAYNVPEDKRGYVPIVFIGDTYYIGDTDALAGLEPKIKGCVDTGAECLTSTTNPDDNLIERFKSFSLLGLIFAALVDSINPCAIAGLIFFLSYLAIIGKKGKSLLLIGFLYTFGVFLAYLLLGIGFTSIVQYAETLASVSIVLYPLTALMALVLVYYNYKDYLLAKAGKTEEMTLQLPQFLKDKIHGLVRSLQDTKFLALSAFVVGFLVSFLEFVCTGQVYLPTIMYIMSVPAMQAQALLYLVIYNLVFVLPLILIFVAAYFGTESHDLSNYLVKHAAKVKLATTIFFILLAVYMIWTSLVLFKLV